MVHKRLRGYLDAIFLDRFMPRQPSQPKWTLIAQTVQWKVQVQEICTVQYTSHFTEDQLRIYVVMFMQLTVRYHVIF